MKKILALCSSLMVLLFTHNSVAAQQSAKDNSNVEYKDNGGYEANRSIEHTSPDGTTYTRESEIDVDVDSEGKVDKTVKSKATTNPEGMMNDKKDTSETQIEEKERGGYKQTTIRKHIDNDGTNVTYKTTTDVEVDTNGKVTTTAITEKTVDPKGWFNSKTTTSKTKTVDGKVVEQKKEVD